MKNVIFVFFAMMLSCFVFGQKIKVDESTDKFAGKSCDVLTVLVYEVEADQVEKEWKSLMRDYKAKNSTSKGEIFSDNATITEMSANTVDVYAKTEKKDNAVKLIVGFDLGGAFVNSSSHSAQYKVGEKIMNDFAVKITKEAIEDKLKTAKREQEKRKDKLDDLVKKNADLKKDIENYKSKISQAEKDIETNVKNQEDATKDLEAQKKVVETISGKLNDVK